MFPTELMFGLATIDQLKPLKCSISVRCTIAIDLEEPAETDHPTAQASDGEITLSPSTSFNNEPVGTGLDTTDQLKPLKCSINVSNSPLEEFAEDMSPIAQMSEAEEADKSSRLLLVVPDGFGLATIDQLKPLKCSMSGTSRALVPAPRAYPTTQTSLAEIASTDERVFTARLVLGLGTTDQLKPLKCSMSVLAWLACWCDNRDGNRE
jgi:hypothetical protein